jgi:hypothetical protein
MFSGKRIALIAALSLSLIVPMQSPASADYASDRNAVENTLRPEQEMVWLTQPLKDLSDKSSYTEQLPFEKALSTKSFATGYFSDAEANISSVRAQFFVNGVENTIWCNGWKDPNCLKPGYILIGYLLLPTCESVTASSGCVESVEVLRANSSTKLTHLRALDSRPTNASLSSNVKSVMQKVEFSELSRLNVPFGATPSIWRNASTRSGTGFEDYLVTAKVMVIATVDKMSNIGDLYWRDFSVTVVPVSEVPVAGSAGLNLTIEENGKLTAVTAGGVQPGIAAVIDTNRGIEQSSCAFQELNTCGLAGAFSDEQSVSATIRLPNQLGGWIQGRADDANVEIKKRDARTNTVSFSGKPTNVQVSGARFVNENVGDWASFWCHGWNYDINIWWKCFNVFESALGETAIGRASTWMFSLIDSNDVGGIDYQKIRQCSSKTPRLEGLLTTNAMVYNGGLPTYKKGALSYQVGGLHYNHDGTVFKGSYDFIMRSDTARCIYGFTKAPVQVAVTVTDVNGVQSASTSSVSESGGWLRIRARDFTFSTPTITAKITQKLSTSVKNDKISQKSLAKIAKVSIGKKDKVTISVSGENKKFAKVTSGNVSFKKNGTYQVKIKVKHHKGATETATISVKVQ